MSTSFQIATGCESWVATAGLRDLEAVFRWKGGERLDKPGLEGWRQRRRMIPPDHLPPGPAWYLKRFDHPPLRRQIERWKRGHWSVSTAGIEWHNARELAAAGIPAVEPIAFGQKMAGPWEVRSFLLMREVPGESLERWLPRNLPPASEEPDLGRRRARRDQLARFVAAFHQAGFVHRDLYLSHIFMATSAAGAGGCQGAGHETFRLIDLQRVFRPRWRRRRWAVKDLAALNFSTPLARVGPRERLRFLCRYVRECNRFGSARRLAGRVAAKTRQMAGHQAT